MCHQQMNGVKNILVCDNGILSTYEKIKFYHMQSMDGLGKYYTK